MGKAINSFIDSQENQQEARETIVLKYIDLLHPNGERTKVVVKKKNKSPQKRVVTKIREVEYIYPSNNPEKKSKVTTGWEIVEEVLMDRDSTVEFKPRVVGKATRLVKRKVQNEQVSSSN
jgi:hypothetical protein